MVQQPWQCIWALDNRISRGTGQDLAAGPLLSTGDTGAMLLAKQGRAPA